MSELEEAAVMFKKEWLQKHGRETASMTPRMLETALMAAFGKYVREQCAEIAEAEHHLGTNGLGIARAIRQGNTAAVQRVRNS